MKVEELGGDQKTHKKEIKANISSQIRTLPEPIHPPRYAPPRTHGRRAED